MSEFYNERIESKQKAQNTDPERMTEREPAGNTTQAYNTEPDDAPAYTSRLQKYHSAQPRKKKKEKPARKSDIVTAEDLNIKSTPASDTDFSKARKLQHDETYEKNVYAVAPAEEETHHKRSSKDADLNIKKLIDLDEGPDTNPIAKQYEKKKMSKTAKAWLIAILCIVVAIVLVLVFVIEIVSIEGQSMEPTLYGGEKIIAEKISRYFEFPSKGQVVVTTYDGYDGYYVKRLIALPGEWVEIYDNVLYVNGEPLEEDYVIPGAEYDDMELMQVPEGCVFLIGDNRAQSLDSRMDSIGPVKAENLVGNAWCVILPFENIRFID